VARASNSNSKRTPEVVLGAPVGRWVCVCVRECLAQANSNHEEVWCMHEWFFCMYVCIAHALMGLATYGGVRDCPWTRV
jgi:hypothetical protein